MTEDLLQYYKELYKLGHLFFKQPNQAPLHLVCLPRMQLYHENQFPEYGYGKQYASRLLKTLE
jgi:hypothetical protein